MANKNASKPLVQSRIPLPLSRNVSKIPTRMSSVNGNARSALIEKVPKRNVNVIKPIISKRRSPSFKDLNGISTISKPIFKKNEILRKQNTAKGLKQTILPPTYFKTSKNNVKDVPAIAVQEASPEKENAPPNSLEPVEDVRSTTATASTQRNKLTALKAQQCLNIVFETNEQSLKQILNKDGRARINSTGSLQGKKNSYMNLEEFRKLSISRPSRAKHSLSATKINPFRESGYDICKAVIELKKAQKETGSPFRQGSKARPNHYEVAMESIRRMSAARASSPLVARVKASLSCSKIPPTKIHPLENTLKRIDSFQIKHQIEETETPPSPIRQTTFVIDKVASPAVKPVVIDGTKSVYRPLKNLMLNSAFKEKKKRLTDISEHSEMDGSTRSLTSSFTNILPLEKSENLTELNLISFNRNSRLSDDPTCNSPMLKLQSASSKKFPAGHLHTPRPISFYGQKATGDNFSFHGNASAQVSCDYAPIRTPLVMQSIARKNEEVELLSPVCVQLNFLEADDCPDNTQKSKSSPEDEDAWDRRFSLSVQHILTKGKLEELRADEECSSFMALQKGSVSVSRMMNNPVAKILTEGDLMHFVPITN